MSVVTLRKLLPKIKIAIRIVVISEINNQSSSDSISLNSFGIMAGRCNISAKYQNSKRYKIRKRPGLEN